MKLSSQKYSILSAIVLLLVIWTILLQSCTATQKIKDKSGVQLWSENCQRCHNTPSPGTYSPEQWETVGLHMQSRALLTDTEREKIVTFLKQ